MEGMKCAAQENVRDLRDLGNLRDLGCLRIIFIFKALEARGIRWRTLGTCNFICLAPWVPNPFFLIFILDLLAKYCKIFLQSGSGTCTYAYIGFSWFPYMVGYLQFYFQYLFWFRVYSPPWEHHRGTKFQKNFTGFFKKNSHLAFPHNGSQLRPRTPNFKVVIQTWCRRPSKKTAIFVGTSNSHSFNIDVRGRGGLVA